MGAVLTALLAVILAVLNTYPILASRDLVISSKENSMVSQAAVMSSSLSALDQLSADAVDRVMQLLDVQPLTRIIITDNTGLILYDTSAEDDSVGRYALLPEIYSALDGKEIFYSSFSDGSFKSRAATPIVSAGTVRGAVYLYEYDEDQAAFIAGLQRNLLNISLAVALLGLALVVLITGALTRRIQKLAAAIRVVRQGDYSYRVRVRGSDEITELQEEFNILTGRLESTEESRRRFVSDASHELRTPLAAIRLLSDSITQSDRMDPATMREFAADIGSEADRLQRTTEKLMSLSRFDAGVTTAAAERSDMAAVVRRTLHLLQPLAATRDVTIRTELAEDCFVLGSPDDLYQIVFNLAENGIKYNISGGEVALLLTQRERTVRLLVEDTGIGIPEEDLASIFDRFYRVDKARSRASGGSGLGLSIVHDAVRANGGTVEVARREGGGTRFTLCFPYAEETT